MPDAEDVWNQVTTDLKSQTFEQLLAAIYAEKGDAVVQYPKEIYPTNKYLPQVFPSGEVSLSGTVRNNSETYVFDTTFNFDVFWHVSGADEERLQTELARLLRAVEDFYRMRTNLLPVPGCTVWTGDTDMSPLIKFGENTPLVKSAVIQLFVRGQR